MTSSADAIAQLFGPLDTGGANLAPMLEIFPDYAAPVIVAAGQGRRLERMTWGWPPPGQVKRPVTNIRNLASPMWRNALTDPARRCLVPVTAFSEWSSDPDPLTGRKRKHWFALRDAELFAFAGLWRPTREGPRFAFLTCEANALVGRVHPKAMPVILDRPEEGARWLSASVEEAAAMQCPLADEAMAEIELADPSPAQGALF
jgi:putative SOS response-associated peptidase YedK